MAGTSVGGQKAAEINRQKYGEDYYRRIGKMGGRTKTTKPKGFAAMSPEKRQAAGHKGGSIGRRGKS